MLRRRASNEELQASYVSLTDGKKHRRRTWINHKVGISITIFCIFVLFFSNAFFRKTRVNKSLPTKIFNILEQEDMKAKRMQIRKMNNYAWDSYLQYANGHDSLGSLSCTGISDNGEYNLTLIDAADTLAVMGETDRFIHAVRLMYTIKNFDIDISVSVFETGIRILGALIACHNFALKLVPEYNGHLLMLATDIGDRLLVAFNTPTGIPFAEINLHSLVASVEDVCTACATSIIIEYGHLTHLTGQSKYYTAAKRATVELFNRRSSKDLVGKSINAYTGLWTNPASKVSAGSDSFYEYLYKAYIIFHDEDYFIMFRVIYDALKIWTERGGVNLEVDMTTGRMTSVTYDNLESFWPAIQVQVGDISPAVEHIRIVGHLMRSHTLSPEKIDLLTMQMLVPYNLLRPEVTESVYFLHSALADPGLRKLSSQIMHRIETYARTKCGYASISNVDFPEHLANHQESFLMSETFKYLYLTFDPANEINTGPYSFTTEAHPVRIFVKSDRVVFKRAKFLNIESQKLKSILNDPRQCSLDAKRKVALQLSFAPVLGYDWMQQEFPMAGSLI